jgi:hypothetical protein
MVDPAPQPPAPPGLDAILPLWLRDWRIFVVLLLVLILGGPEVRDGVKSLIGIAPTAAVASNCCEQIGPRIDSLERAMQRNDAAHARILQGLALRGMGPAQSKPHDETHTSSLASEVPAP